MDNLDNLDTILSCLGLISLEDLHSKDLQVLKAIRELTIFGGATSADGSYKNHAQGIKQLTGFTEQFVAYSINRLLAKELISQSMDAKLDPASYKFVALYSQTDKGNLLLEQQGIKFYLTL
jgi:hypothetical protein